MQSQDLRKEFHGFVPKQQNTPQPTTANPYERQPQGGGIKKLAYQLPKNVLSSAWITEKLLGPGETVLREGVERSAVS